LLAGKKPGSPDCQGSASEGRGTESGHDSFMEWIRRVSLPGVSKQDQASALENWGTKMQSGVMMDAMGAPCPLLASMMNPTISEN
jgi:hypothetical protein